MNSTALIPFVQLRLADGRQVHVSPPAIIGRMATADLCIPDPRLSEAHALISHRGSDLRILSLRGRISLGPRVVEELTLAAGQDLLLADEVLLRIERVVLPQRAISIHGVTGESTIVGGGVYSLLPADRGLMLHTGYRPGACAYLLCDCFSVSLVVGDTPAEELQIPSTFLVDSHRLSLISLPLITENQTLGPPSSVPAERLPVRITSRGDTVRLEAPSRAPLVLGGLAARILAEVIAMGGGPVHWKVVADEIWPGEDNVLHLTDKWQKAVQRLRSKLISGGLRENLVYRDRSGLIELLLLDGDVVVEADDGPDEPVDMSLGP